MTNPTDNVFKIPPLKWEKIPTGFKAKTIFGDCHVECFDKTGAQWWLSNPGGKLTEGPSIEDGKAKAEAWYFSRLLPALEPVKGEAMVNASPADALRPNDRHGQIPASDNALPPWPPFDQLKPGGLGSSPRLSDHGTAVILSPEDYARARAAVVKAFLAPADDAGVVGQKPERLRKALDILFEAEEAAESMLRSCGCHGHSVARNLATAYDEVRHAIDAALAPADDAGVVGRLGEAQRIDAVVDRLKELRTRMADSVENCCGQRAGKSFCESYGCGTLKTYIHSLDAALALAADAGNAREKK